MTKSERVQLSISRRIESGSLREGDRLPSEEQLAAQFHVSVGTVQKALDRLEASRLIKREHGRGTFVSGAPAADVNYLRFRDGHGVELPNFIQVRSARQIRRAGPWAEFLGAPAPWVRIERRISVGGKFELASEFWLREAEFEKLGSDRRVLERNIRVQLGQQLSLPTLHVDQTLRFCPLPGAVAADLGLEEDAPGLVMEMRGYTLRERPLFYHRVFSGPFAEDLVIVR